MARTNTLRRELLTAFAVVFAGALIVAVTGVLLLLPTFDSPGRALVYLTALLGGDLIVFFLFGRWLVHSRVLLPLERMVLDAEAIADGDHGRRLPEGWAAHEIDRLSASLNRMAERLISHQRDLARNVESLERTNRELTDARDDLIRAEKMASLGQMAAGVAHEIGNPLAAIMGNVDLLGRRAEGQQKELATATAEQAQRIDRIVRGLLDYARTREARVRPIDINEVVVRTVEMVGAQPRLKGVDVAVDLDAGIPAVAADPYQLEQVLVNLMLNAADAMEGCAERTIHITSGASRFVAPVHTPARRKDDPPGIDYSHRRRFNRPERVPRLQPFEPGEPLVEVRVEDCGRGIPEDAIQRIFEPFMTTKEPGTGTGLGLAVSARLIDGMSGTIRAENTERGAVFTIQLPASEEPAEALSP